VIDELDIKLQVLSERTATKSATMTALKAALAGLETGERTARNTAVSAALKAALVGLETGERKATQTATREALKGALDGLETGQTTALKAALEGLKTAQASATKEATSSALKGALDGLTEARATAFATVDKVGVALKDGFTLAITGMFRIAVLIALLGCLVTGFLPKVTLRDGESVSPSH
jgi:hypothetical protein